MSRPDGTLRNFIVQVLIGLDRMVYSSLEMAPAWGWKRLEAPSHCLILRSALGTSTAFLIEAEVYEG